MAGGRADVPASRRGDGRWVAFPGGRDPGSASNRERRETAADLVCVHRARIKDLVRVEPKPLPPLRVLLVARTGEHRLELRPAPDASTVLGRAGALRRDEVRIGDAGLGLQDLFDHDLVL